MYRFTVSLLLSTCAASTLLAQEPPTEPPATPAAAAPVLPGGRGAAANAEPQPYDKVITKDAKSKTGVFTVHEIKDKYYYEIPKSELNKEFLWNTQIAKTTEGAGYGGQQLADRVVRWPSIRWRRMSRGTLEAWILPATWNVTAPFGNFATATEEFSPSRA